MACPSSYVSKILITLLILIVFFYVYMDLNLYLRIQNYPIDPRGGNNLNIDNNNNNNNNNNITNYKDISWIGCEISPLCDVTVKAVLLDHTNYYLFAPLVTLVDMMLKISENEYITPNLISIFHVFIAIISAKCISSDSLSYRRLGVLLFELRTFLDDMDGHVARVRKHVKGERSEVGTTGYYVDGICDALGTTALIIGTFIFLKNNPPRRGYMQLPTTNPTPINDTKETNIIYKSKITSNKISKKLLCFTAQLILSSMAWNRYIALYQDMLERDINTNTNNDELVRRTIVFKSSFFFAIALLWRLFNVHNMLHLLLLSIFCDKLWEFLCKVQYVGFAVLLFVICVTEIHVTEVKNFIYHKGIISNSTSF